LANFAKKMSVKLPVTVTVALPALASSGDAAQIGFLLHVVVSPKED
jgi:hypothetical protein